MKKKREILKEYDVKRLARMGVVPANVVRNMQMYDYYKEAKENARNPVALTAGKYGVDTRTVLRAVRDMETFF